jgi:GMP synthase-like glutamine amidotransferase
MVSTRPVLVLQHGPNGPPGVLGEWLREREIPFEIHRVWEQPLELAPGDYRAIVSLGSEHAPRVGAPSWVEHEVGFLREAVAGDVPVLGLCFGGEALAVALGGEIVSAPRPEVGWMEVSTRDPRTIPPGPWLHFHWEAVRLPAQAQEIARTSSGPAAFRAGPHLGTQFHPEATPEIVAAWTRHEAERGRLEPLGLSEESMAQQGRDHGAGAARAARRLFDAWWEGVAAARSRG